MNKMDCWLCGEIIEVDAPYMKTSIGGILCTECFKMLSKDDDIKVYIRKYFNLKKEEQLKYDP